MVGAPPPPPSPPLSLPPSFSPQLAEERQDVHHPSYLPESPFLENLVGIRRDIENISEILRVDCIRLHMVTPLLYDLQKNSNLESFRERENVCVSPEITGRDKFIQIKDRPYRRAADRAICHLRDRQFVNFK